MPELRGPALLATVTTLTSLGFLMIGYDNGLLGGLVNGDAFNSTFNKPSQTMIGTIVSIYNSRFYVRMDACGRSKFTQIVCDSRMLPRRSRNISHR